VHFPPNGGDASASCAFFDSLAEHRMSIRHTNPIEPAFSNVCRRTKFAREAVNRQGTVAMTFKVGIDAQKRWMRINECA